MRQMQWAATTEFRDRRFTWREKLQAWRHGFLADSAALYEFPRNDLQDYLSDYVRENQTVRLNPVAPFFDHKLMMRALLLRHGFAQADTFALFGPADAQLDPFGTPRLVSLGALEEALRIDGGPFIVKPEESGFGYGVARIEVRDGVLTRRRGLTASPYRVKPRPRGVALVERVVQQHAFWRQLFPDSVNTIRILTLLPPGDAVPFVAAAAQRIGATDTAPTDNFAGGGIAAPIDLDTGTLGHGVRRTPTGPPERLTHHPETRARIEGARLPYWDRICATVLNAATLMGVARYVGWDVVVDERGMPVIIEGNSNTGVHVLQLGRGLLSNPDVRRFYESCGVL
jgi:hypothetical protein